MNQEATKCVTYCFWLHTSTSILDLGAEALLKGGYYSQIANEETKALNPSQSVQKHSLDRISMVSLARPLVPGEGKQTLGHNWRLGWQGACGVRCWLQSPFLWLSYRMNLGSLIATALCTSQ